MSGRERMLGVPAGAIIAVFLLYMAIDGLLLSPANELDDRAADLARSNAQMTKDRDFHRVRAARLDGLARRTLSSNADRASEKLRARLTELLQRSGLGISLKPMGGMKVKDAYGEVAWLVTSEGELQHVIDFLYLLKAEPYLHRMENLSLKSKPRGGRMEVKLRYATIVLPRQKGETLGEGEFPAPKDTGDLEGEERQLYDVLVARNLFRPYIPRKVVRRPPPEKPGIEPTKPRDHHADLYVVSLTTWAGQQEVLIRDRRREETRNYRPGEPLAGGKIVMIDYRKMPMPDKAEILSGSRMILEIAGEYWAVELGQSLAQKRRLTHGQLPGELKSKPESKSRTETGEALPAAGG